jgi:hypothetical protein
MDEPKNLEYREFELVGRDSYPDNMIEPRQ